MKKKVARRSKLSYGIKLSKRGKSVRWLVIEKPTGSIVCESAFESDAKKVCSLQNKYKQWENQGGVVDFLTYGKI